MAQRWRTGGPDRDLKAGPTTWLTGDLTLQSILPGVSGDLAITLAGTTPEGTTGLFVARYQAATRAWSTLALLETGPADLSSSSAATTRDKGMALVFAQLPDGARAQAGSNSKTAQIHSVPELANVRLVLIPGEITVDPSTIAVPPNRIVLIIAGIAVGLVVLSAGTLILNRKRK